MPPRPTLSGEMVRQARVLAQATSDLVNAMRSDAEAEVDLDNSKKLLAAAKLLADATARMVEAAKVSDVPRRLTRLALLLRPKSSRLHPQSFQRSHVVQN